MMTSAGRASTKMGIALSNEVQPAAISPRSKLGRPEQV